MQFRLPENLVVLQCHINGRLLLTRVLKQENLLN